MVVRSRVFTQWLFGSTMLDGWAKKFWCNSINHDSVTQTWLKHFSAWTHKQFLNLNSNRVVYKSRSFWGPYKLPNSVSMHPKHTYFNGLTVTLGWHLRISTTNTLEGRFAAGSLVGLDVEALRGCDVKPVTPVYAWDNEIQVAQRESWKWNVALTMKNRWPTGW